MPIQLINGSIFLHVPKAGGSWITNVLEENGLVKQKFGEKHDDWARTFQFGEFHKTADGAMRFLAKTAYRKLLGKELNLKKKPETFCFVRHPISWYESYFKYCESLGWPTWGSYENLRYYHPKAPLDGLGDKDFNKFIENVLNSRPGYLTELYGQFAQPPVKHIGKQESLAEDLLRILKDLGLNVDEERILSHKKVNVSKRPSKTLEWDQTLREELIKTEYAVIKRFGYTAEPPKRA